MSSTSAQSNPALFNLRRLGNRYDEQASEIVDFTRRQASGESVDPEAFMHLLEQRSVTQQAMQAQFKLHEKPLKTVLNETK